MEERKENVDRNLKKRSQDVFYRKEILCSVYTSVQEGLAVLDKAVPHV